MRKLLIAAAAFLVFAITGLILVVAGSLLPSLLQIASQRTSGIGAVAGGVSNAAVLVVPLLCGAAGAALALRQLNRRKR